MRKFILALSVFCLILFVPMAKADDPFLFSWAFNFNGDIQAGNNPDVPGAPPAGWTADYTHFDFNTGMGTLSFSFNPGVSGSYNFLAFLDHDIGPFPFDSNTGFSFGTPDAGMTWQLGPPGYPGDGGDTYFMFAADTLKNLNEIDPGEYGDISAAFGWSFVNDGTDPSNFYLTVSNTAPTSGFYLSEFDASTGTIIYLSPTNAIPGSIPEPGTLGLVGAGLVAAAAWARRKFSL